MRNVFRQIDFTNRINLIELDPRQDEFRDILQGDREVQVRRSELFSNLNRFFDLFQHDPDTVGRRIIFCFFKQPRQPQGICSGIEDLKHFTKAAIKTHGEKEAAASGVQGRPPPGFRGALYVSLICSFFRDSDPEAPPFSDIDPVPTDRDVSTAWKAFCAKSRSTSSMAVSLS